MRTCKLARRSLAQLRPKSKITEITEITEMASYKKFDPRLESLVVETRTVFDSEVEAEILELDEHLDSAEGSDVDTHEKLSALIHSQPQLASQIFYERAHTGFTREITVTRADVERLFTELAATSR